MTCTSNILWQHFRSCCMAFHFPLTIFFSQSQKDRGMYQNCPLPEPFLSSGRRCNQAMCFYYQHHLPFVSFPLDSSCPIATIQGLPTPHHKQGHIKGKCCQGLKPLLEKQGNVDVVLTLNPTTLIKMHWILLDIVAIGGKKGF